MEPFNIKIQNTTQGAEKPNNQEVTQNADGSGGPISIAKKKDACYTKVKSRYKKWPSAFLVTSWLAGYVTAPPFSFTVAVIGFIY